MKTKLLTCKVNQKNISRLKVEETKKKKNGEKRWRVKNIVTCSNVYLKYKKKGTEQTSERKFLDDNNWEFSKAK